MNSWKNLLETSDTPLLVRGGPSSSDILNRINKNIVNDITQLGSDVQGQDRIQKLLSIYLEQQAIGLQGLVSSLQTQIPAAPSNRGVADFFSTDYVDISTTATVDEDFGQVTLPILSIQEKLHSVDSQGNVWIPEDSRIRFYSSSTYTAGTIPSDDYFLSSVEDYLGIGSQSNTFFIGGHLNSSSYLYVKAILPQSLNTHKLSNRITFYPIPAFSHSLVGAYYRKTDGSWNSISIDYLPRYTTVTSPYEASYLGPTRLHFPPSEITQVCLVLKANGWWGMQQLGVQLVEYSSTADLVTDMSSYNPNNINTVIVNGKDQNVLNSLTSVVNGNKITTTLSQSAAYASPVIVAVDSRW